MESSTAHTVTMIPGNAQPTIQYLMKVFLMSEACLLVSRTAQNKIYLKNLEYILKNSHRHHDNLSYSHCLLVNFGIFKLSLNFLFAFKGRSACYELKGDLSPIMLNEIFHDNMKTSKFTRICMENHSSVTGWQVFRLLQILLTFGGRYNRYF